MCIMALWQNRQAVHEQGRHVHIGELGSRLGQQHSQGGKKVYFWFIFWVFIITPYLF